jgi:predicted nuclease of restriction endonuclease-like (RecB) superfamily
MTKKYKKPEEVQISQELFKDISALIEQSRKRVALRVNMEMTLLNWHIGKAISTKILGNQRGGYGEQIVETVSKQLTEKYGNGFDQSALRRRMLFFKQFNDEKKLATLSQHLSWSHFVELITIQDDMQREFYLELSRKEGWGIRVLRDRIDSMLYERTMLSKKPETLIKQELDVLKSEGTVTPDLVFRDPYLLNFLGLKDTYSEQDLESSILHQLQLFIIELGTDFAFVARQKRIIIDGEDFRIDLLFFHRGLRRIVAIDLKLGKFKAAYKGQMELYLKWLEKYERREGEENPIGLILCAEKQQEQIELLELDKGHIRVAEYMTQLPTKEIFADKLQQAISLAKEKAKIVL